jgi:hypothetical protein
VHEKFSRALKKIFVGSVKRESHAHAKYPYFSDIILMSTLAVH